MTCEFKEKAYHYSKKAFERACAEIDSDNSKLTATTRKITDIMYKTAKYYEKRSYNEGNWGSDPLADLKSL